MNFSEYTEFALKCHTEKHDDVVTYLTLAVCGEAGELAEKRKKQLRKDPKGPTTEDMIKEMGDVLWYLNALAKELGTTLEQVAKTNMEKTAVRMANNTLQGSGDNR